MGEQSPAVDHIEMIARQGGVVCASMDEVNIGVAIGFGMASRDGELVGTRIDRGDFALWTHIAGKPSRGVAGAAADVGERRPRGMPIAVMIRSASGP
jgi:hypothetical protein